MRSSAEVVLVNPPYARRRAGGVVPPMGLAYLASVLRERGTQAAIHDVAAQMPDFSLDESNRMAVEVAAIVAESAPALIGIGPLVTANLQPTRALIRQVRQLTTAPIVVGGPLCAAPGMMKVAEDYLGCDAFVVGDGEEAIACMWESVSAGQAPNSGPGVARLGNEMPAPARIEELDGLPIPARDLLPPDAYFASARREIAAKKVTSVFLSRGCPYACIFCAAPLASGRRVRRFSNPRIVDELNSCADLGFEDLIFYDDCLFIKSPSLDRKVRSFAEAILASRWRGRYQLELRCDAVVALSDSSLSLLRESGCRQINMGIEKATVASLQSFRKNLTPDVAQLASERLVQAGIRAAGTFIIGGVMETEENIGETVEFALGLPLDFAQFNPLAVYPGTELFSRVFADRDWLDLCLSEEWAPWGDILWRSDDVPLAMILQTVQDAYQAFYSPERLQDALKRTPDDQQDTLRRSYVALRTERPASWDRLVQGAAC